MGRVKKLFLVILVFAIFFNGVSAEPQRIISNSNDWRDVYSTLIYANLQGLESNFLVNTAHSTLLLFSVPKSEEIQVISSSDNRYIVGYDEIILGQGYPAESEELVLDDVNFELAQRLENINKYIIVDDSYGYNAISVAPYAVIADYYVLFADDRSINRVANFLEEKNPEDIIIYGNVDREVKDRLAIFNPETINEGDRFDNNFAIVDKYLEVKPTRQAILTSGEFIESSLFTGFDPVIFIGKTNVPDKVQTYVQSSDIDIGILIGNELVGVATTIRRQVGISVFVKFAQGARRPTGRIAQVEDLDRFAMPSYTLNIDVDSVIYNQATQSLEVTYRNLEDLATYVKSTIRVESGGDTFTLADKQSFFLEGEELKTIIYEETADGEQLRLTQDSARGEVFSVFGEAPNALEFQLSKNFDIEFIDVEDTSELEIVDVTFDKTRSRFLVKVRNIGDVGLYSTAEIYDLYVNGEEVTYGSGQRPYLEKGKSETIVIEAPEFSEADFADNPTVFVRSFYGQRQTALIKVAEAEMPLKFTSLNWLIIVVIVVLVLLFLLLFFVKKKCKHCKTKNYLWNSRCKKCKGRL